MEEFYLKVYLFRPNRVPPIKIARNSKLKITIETMDYTIPVGATASAFAKGAFSVKIYTQKCTVDGNRVSFTPKPGFFVQGRNILQYEIGDSVIPLAIDVNCEISLPDEGDATKPDSVKPYIQRAEVAAKKSEAAATRAEEVLQEIQQGTGNVPTVYCWGDSLTEGVGGWLPTQDGIQNAIVCAYPDMVAQRFPCVNLGCRGETIQTIMARQGADPMVVGGFTIPADASEDVIVGYLRGNYYSEDRLGIETKSGDLAQPLAENEAGINPCVLAGVEGELFRDMVKDESGRYAYRFRRLKSGEAVPVPEKSMIETNAMRRYRNGVAVIWMGANGSVSSHGAYIEKIKQMVAYGNYSNYLVIVAREYTSQWVLEDANSIQKALTDERGVCHLLYLPPLLQRRGYSLAGIAASAGVPDTSGWTTTDEIKKNVPLLMCSNGGNGEESFDSLHFSCYGYKAIGKLVTERLEELIWTEAGLGYETDGTDEFGAFAFKLTRPMTGTGSAVNTQVRLYDTEKDWTIACRFSEDMVVSDGTLGCVFETRKYFSNDSTQTAAYLRLLPQTDGTMAYNFAGGFGGFNFPFDNNSGYTEPTDGYHTAVIAKQGGNYWFYLDGALAYNSSLGYQVTEDHLHNEPLYLFGREEGGGEYNTVTGIMDDFRVYNSYLDKATVETLLASMNG